MSLKEQLRNFSEIDKGQYVNQAKELIRELNVTGIAKALYAKRRAFELERELQQTRSRLHDALRFKSGSVDQMCERNAMLLEIITANGLQVPEEERPQPVNRRAL